MNILRLVICSNYSDFLKNFCSYQHFSKRLLNVAKSRSVLPNSLSSTMSSCVIMYISSFSRRMTIIITLIAVDSENQCHIAKSLKNVMAFSFFKRELMNKIGMRTVMLFFFGWRQVTSSPKPLRLLGIGLNWILLYLQQLRTNS